MAVVLPNFCDDSLGNGIGGKGEGPRIAHSRFGRMAVLPVVVPAPPQGLGAVHENAEASSPFAVKVFQEQALAT
jgi:hypothetical protein